MSDETALVTIKFGEECTTWRVSDLRIQEDKDVTPVRNPGSDKVDSFKCGSTRLWITGTVVAQAKGEGWDG